jgi:hypothetical protein
MDLTKLLYVYARLTSLLLRHCTVAATVSITTTVTATVATGTVVVAPTPSTFSSSRRRSLLCLRGVLGLEVSHQGDGVGTARLAHGAHLAVQCFVAAAVSVAVVAATVPVGGGGGWWWWGRREELVPSSHTSSYGTRTLRSSLRLLWVEGQDMPQQRRVVLMRQGAEGTHQTRSSCSSSTRWRWTRRGWEETCERVRPHSRLLFVLLWMRKKHTR